MIWTEIIVGAVVFTTVVTALSLLILFARSKLVASGIARIIVNDERTVEAALGGKLLGVLADAGLYVPSGCGGKGTCGQCRIQLLDGGGSALPTERSQLSHDEVARNVRLACQVAVREDLSVRVPDEVFGVRQWACKVRSNRNVSTYIKELVLELPQDEVMDFRAGGYIQVECPPFTARFTDFQIDERFRPEWDRYQLWRYKAGTDEATSRAYSMANYPGEKGVIILNVRIATPPPGATDEIPPGIVSSYIFKLRPGDPVTILGPFGEFFARDTDKEMIYIGGGAGMAPLRSHIFDLLKRVHSDRKISFWYGGRARQELFYVEEFDRLATEHANFSWHVALSEPAPQDNWQGPQGFIHDVVYREYLAQHAAPEECEYYLCGPPLMMAAVMKMLDDLGVDRDSILFDDFGM